MKVKGSTFFLSTLLVCGLAVGFAQQLDVDRELEEAKALYREAKFAQAIGKLHAVIGRLEQLRDLQARRIQLSDAHLHLALSYVALNDPSAAKESLKQMLRADRNRRLDPDVYAPKVIELFEEARAEVAKEPATPAAAPAPASSPQAAVAKKGGSKAPLIALGVGGAAAAGVALAAGGGGGGSSASASPTPTPTLSGSDNIALITAAPPTGSTISASQGRPLYTMTFSVVYSRDLPIGALHVELRGDDGTLCSVYEPGSSGELFALAAGRAQTISVRDNDPHFPRCALPSTTAIARVVLYPCPSAAPCSCCDPGMLIDRTFNVRYTFIP